MPRIERTDAGNVLIPSVPVKQRAVWLLVLLPVLATALVCVAPITTDPRILFGGLGYALRRGWLPGFMTIDPNMGFTSFALGTRAALDVLAGQLPLWNPYEGLGAPLLGEMQAAALFPPTLLLLLPHGQLIEQASLQIVAGFGTYLFLRRLGLGVTAAVAGGIFFAFNGVFAWLRNAIFNPVALLPWLFYAAESLFAEAGAPFRRRLKTIGLGAIAAALAIYAGFPEIVYFYCFPLLAWVLVRAGALPWRQRLAYLADLALMSVIALAVASPLLLAFWHMLAEGYVGPHRNAGFKDAALAPASLIMYLVPYLFGPISYSSDPAIAPMWGSIGGYAGLAVSVLAIAGALSAWRRPIAWVLGGWVALAIAISHGAPVVHDVFVRLPLTAIAAFPRYMNAGWLFCGVTLAAIFIDDVATMPSHRRRLVGRVALGIALLTLAGAIVAAWPALAGAWPHHGPRAYIVASAITAALLLAGVAAALRIARPHRAQAVLATLAAAELLLFFLVPFASNPAGGKVDTVLIDYLQRHLGFQRVAIAAGNGISPNFGSALGIATINYDDLPVPNRTVDYVRNRLDPKLEPIMFRANLGFRHETAEERRTAFLQRIPAYAAAGVSHVLAPPGFFAFPAYALADVDPTARRLAAGESIVLDLQPPAVPSTIRAALVTVATYGGRADGTLRVQACQDGQCREAEADLSAAADNGILEIPFTPPLLLAVAPVRLTLSRHGGVQPVALWSRPPASGDGDGLRPILRFAGADDPMLVLTTPTTGIYALQASTPYASAPGCTVDIATHDRMTAQCERPSRLTRLEVLMTGWTAEVNLSPVQVDLVDDTFQSIALPAGRSTIAFIYAPPGVRPALRLAAATLIALTATLFAAGKRGHRWREGPP